MKIVRLGRDTEVEQKAEVGIQGTEPGPQGKGGEGWCSSLYKNKSLCMVEAEKVVLRGARASPSVGVGKLEAQDE